MMESSDYIFEQAETTFHIGNVIAIVIICFGLYQLFRILKKQRYFLNNDKKNDRMPLFLLPVLLGIGILFSTANYTNKMRRIKNYEAETFGVTIERTITKSSSTIKYKFIINKKNYYSECGYTYDGDDIKGIIVPGGRYKVIYNSEDPNESIMDFKINE